MESANTGRNLVSLSPFEESPIDVESQCFQFRLDLQELMIKRKLFILDASPPPRIRYGQDVLLVTLDSLGA